MTLRIERTPLGSSPLVRDYLNGEAAGAFFHGLPNDLACYREHAAALIARSTRTEREEISAMLRPVSPRAAERLAHFVDQGGVVVTTGQQTGLFTGPLYTIYKILSAVHYAAALERELGAVVLPVFWSASEDHDWEEVNHAMVLDQRGEVRRVELRLAESRPLSMSRRPVPVEFESALEEMRHALARQPYTEWCLEQIGDAYRDAESFAAGFGRLVEILLAPFDLLVVDAANPVLKRRSVPVLRTALARANEAEAAVTERTRALVAAGYAAQVAVLSGATNVFLEDERGRHRLYRTESGWRASEDRRVYSLAELDALLTADPGRLSPNVLLRPVVESAVLPVLAYVGGPGEIAYWAQLGDLFDLHDVAMPLVLPRASFTLVRDELQEQLAEHGLAWRDLAVPEHRLATHLARAGVPAEVKHSLAELRSETASRYAALISASQAVDPTLAGPLGAARNAAALGTARAERKILAAVKRRDAERIAELLRTRAELVPGGAPQDRVLNVFSYLARFGPGLLDEIESRIALPWESASTMAENS